MIEVIVKSEAFDSLFREDILIDSGISIVLRFKFNSFRIIAYIC